MYFIRVSWKCIANVEMEAEGGGGREEGEKRVRVGRELDSSHTSGLTSYLYNRRAGKPSGPLSDTRASLVPGFRDL